MRIKSLWFDHKLEVIEIFLDRATFIDDEYNKALLRGYTGDPTEDAEADHALDVILTYQDIVIKAVFGELNALVEWELKRLARTIPDHPRKLSRKLACETIERHYGIIISDLPRFDEVDRIRQVMNAYKHDDGFSGEYEEIIGNLVQAKQRYKLDWENALQSIKAVKEFLRALPGERECFSESRRIIDNRFVLLLQNLSQESR